MHDRRHVIGHLPIWLQEVVQAILWTQMNTKDTERRCLLSNRMLSFAITVIVHAVPVAFAVKAWVGMQYNPGTLSLAGRAFRKRLKLVMRQALIWAIALPLITGALMLNGVWIHVCTVRGPHGHQIWPLVMLPVPSGIEYAFAFRLAMWAAYFMVVSRPMYMDPAPDFAVAAFNIVGPFTVVSLVLWLGDEWGSSWCFLASLLCIFYLVSPLVPVNVAPPDPVARILLEEYKASQSVENRQLLASESLYSNSVCVSTKEVQLQVAMAMPSEASSP